MKLFIDMNKNHNDIDFSILALYFCRETIRLSHINKRFIQK